MIEKKLAEREKGRKRSQLKEEWRGEWAIIFLESLSMRYTKSALFFEEFFFKRMSFNNAGRKTNYCLCSKVQIHLLSRIINLMSPSRKKLRKDSCPFKRFEFPMCEIHLKEVSPCCLTDALWEMLLGKLVKINIHCLQPWLIGHCFW